MPDLHERGKGVITRLTRAGKNLSNAWQHLDQTKHEESALCCARCPEHAAMCKSPFNLLQASVTALCGKAGRLIALSMHSNFAATAQLSSQVCN